MNNINNIIKILSDSKKTVFFGGAGVSTESGIKDFRSKDGLYNETYKYSPEEILSHHFFINNTKEFYIFYKNRLDSRSAIPNTTHKVLKMMEDKNLLSSIITQNIDGLHEFAGSKNILELHGSIYRNHCTKCNKFYDKNFVFNCKDVPTCECGGIIKPDVVLYEEPLNNAIIDNSIYEISTADVLIIGGTSLNVYPAAGLIKYFKGKYIILINNEATVFDDLASIVIHESIGKVFKKIKESLFLKEVLILII